MMQHLLQCQDCGRPTRTLPPDSPGERREKFFMSRRFAVLVRLGGGVSLVVFFALAFTPLAAWLSRWLERPAHLEPASAIVVLGGGGVHSDRTRSDSSMRRTRRGIDLYQRGLAPLLVLSGPRFTVGLAEGDVRSAVARNRGVAP